MSEDKYGCDDCYETGELYCCEFCDAVLCRECVGDAHNRREHIYPIYRWRGNPLRLIRLGKQKRAITVARAAVNEGR
jgi:hypothetical protein